MHKNLDQSNFLNRLHEETKIFNNFPGIMEKLEKDGNLDLLFNTFTHVISSEIGFAIVRSLIRAQEDEDDQPESRHPKAAGHQPVHLQGEPQGRGQLRK